MLFLPILLTIATPFFALWREFLLAVSHDSSLVLRMSHVLVRLAGGQPVLVVPPPMYELVHVIIAVAQPVCLWSEEVSRLSYKYPLPFLIALSLPSAYSGLHDRLGQGRVQAVGEGKSSR